MSMDRLLGPLMRAFAFLKEVLRRKGNRCKSRDSTDLELRKVSTKSTRKITLDMLKTSQFSEMVWSIRKPKNW